MLAELGLILPSEKVVGILAAVLLRLFFAGHRYRLVLLLWQTQTGEPGYFP